MVGQGNGWRLLLTSALLLATALGTPHAAAQSRDLWLEAELEPRQVLVQAQAIYRLRFYHAVDVRELKINGPSARLADLRPIGPERVFEALRDGRRYRVHERRYAVFPLGSGPLTLTGAYALGRVAVASATSADGRQAVRLEAATQTLTVLAVPAAAGAFPWLPARSLSLTESWSTPATGLRPGQALRRSIRIEAAGVDAGQIPPLQVLAPGMQVEAEVPRLENRMVGELNVGVREQVFQMVALRAGELQVPELQLRWWSLGIDALAVATLPARALRVVAAEATAPREPASARAKTSASPPAMQAPQQAGIASAGWLLWLVTSALLLFFALLLVYRRRPHVRAAARLQRACRQGYAGAVRDALLAWAASSWPHAPPLTLEALAEQGSDPAVRQALQLMDRSLYGPPSERPDGAALRVALRTIQRGSGRWFKSRRQTSSH